MELSQIKNEKFVSSATSEQISDSSLGKLRFIYFNCQVNWLKKKIGEDFENVNFSHGVENNGQGGSSFLAYFNIVCVVAGTGSLGLPYALKQGGWIGTLKIQHIVQFRYILPLFIGLLILGLSWLFSSCKYWRFLVFFILGLLKFKYRFWHYFNSLFIL